jgi:glycosyltransferase involved in cell wall biosynthesis
MEKEILFLCGCFPKEIANEIFENSIGLPQFAADEYAWNFINGIETNIDKPITIVTAPFIGYYPRNYKKIVFKGSKWARNKLGEDQIIGFINIKGIETIIKSFQIYHECKRWYKKSKENRIIIVYSHYAGFLEPIGRMKKKFNDLQVCCIVTDLPEQEKSMDGRFSLLTYIKSIPREIMFKTTLKNLPYIDSFVLLTKEMKNPLNIQERPYCVVEGMCNSVNIPQEKPSKWLLTNSIKIVYTGTLDEKYGITKLIESFQIVKTNCELFICGDGDSRTLVLAAANRYKRIHYLGVVNHNQILEIQSEADILVNPRPPLGVYTKYSFPSKIIEYLYSGKPILSFKLSGIPEEYDDYLAYFEEYTIESMASKIDEICGLPYSELKTIGLRNKEFALHFKNNIVQTSKIIQIIYDKNQ